MSEQLELHAVFKGRVQGVGFRWTVVDYAEKFHLTGTTKNLSDGTVEVFAHGTKESLEAFVTSVKQDAGLAGIDSVVCRYQPSNHSYRDFRIIY